MRKSFVFIFLSFLWFCSVASAENFGQDNISAVKFDSLLVDNSSGVNHLKLGIQAKKAGSFEVVLDVRKAAQKSLEYFFIGLLLQDEAFWVNLNPAEPYRIVDASLGNTDLGRIMLNADLHLKQDVCWLTNPEVSKTGRQFWTRLYARAEQLGVRKEIPVVNRLWIVPGEIIVYEEGSRISLIKSKLRVCLESAYLSEQVKIKDKRQRELQDFASSLMEELILPSLNKKVNEAYLYAELRDVFHALILARWYKRKFNFQQGSLLQTVNFNILEDAQATFPHSPEKIYQSYIRSLNKGEYSFTENEYQITPFGEMITTKHYFSGGVDFTELKMTKEDSLSQAQSRENVTYFSCDLFLPPHIERPLLYAKSQLQLTPAEAIQNQDMPFALAAALPAITPINFAKESIQNLDYVGRTDRFVLSKL